MVSSPGFYIFQIFDDYSVSLPLLIIALFQIVAISWVYGNDRLVFLAVAVIYTPHVLYKLPFCLLHPQVSLHLLLLSVYKLLNVCRGNYVNTYRITEAGENITFTYHFQPEVLQAGCLFLV